MVTHNSDDIINPNPKLRDTKELRVDQSFRLHKVTSIVLDVRQEPMLEFPSICTVYGYIYMSYILLYISYICVYVSHIHIIPYIIIYILYIAAEYSVIKAKDVINSLLTLMFLL